MTPGAAACLAVGAAPTQEQQHCYELCRRYSIMKDLNTEKNVEEEGDIQVPDQMIHNNEFLWLLSTVLSKEQSEPVFGPTPASTVYPLLTCLDAWRSD